MPTNLNALIRYKTIDNCLGNKHVKWTIQRLQDACSQTLGEARGVYKTISERTIRDDIRVMRSDILGFNAPIVFENGCYFYSEKNYSIFNQSIADKATLSAVYNMLLSHKKEFNSLLVNKSLLLLANALDTQLPQEILNEMLNETDSEMNNSLLVIEHLKNKAIQTIMEEKNPGEKTRSLTESTSTFNERFSDSSTSYHNDLQSEKDYLSIIAGTESAFPWQSILLLLNHR